MSAQKKRRYAKVKENECVACGSCIKNCPKKAVTIHRGIYAVIDREVCVGCAICQKNCPASVITIQNVSDKV